MPEMVSAGLYIPGKETKPKNVFHRFYLTVGMVGRGNESTQSYRSEGEKEQELFIYFFDIPLQHFLLQRIPNIYFFPAKRVIVL